MSKTAQRATIATRHRRYIPEISQSALVTPATGYRPQPWSALDPLVPRHVQNKHGRAAERHFHWIGHVELARLHDRGHRVDELASGVAGLPNDRDHFVDLRLLHPGEDRGVGLLEEAPLRVQPRDPEILVGERVDERSRVLRMHDRHDHLHRAATIPRASRDAARWSTEIGHFWRCGRGRARASIHSPFATRHPSLGREAHKLIDLAADVRGHRLLRAVAVDHDEAARFGRGEA